MRTRISKLLCVACTLISLAFGLAPAHAEALPPEAAEAARHFLFAFARNDRDAIRSMLPAALNKFYGPCPFARIPTLTNPRADTRIGAIDFEGATSDPDLPPTGTIVLRYVVEDGTKAWRVRQIYWYRELPPEAEVPEKSRTAADRREEPKVREAAIQFLKAWLDGDYGRMDGLTFHWWEVARDPPKWIRMTGADLEARSTTLDGVRVDFVATLRLVRLLTKRVRGNLWVVHENGRWRVRPLTFAFWF